ncbi:MAG: Maf-like protein [Prevotellaceae bacterium]|nr:Maf-like protein [Prevotellaceae bacterium]
MENENRNGQPLRLILASGSPRRRELLSALGLDFEVRLKKGVEEHYPSDLPAGKVAEYIAREKAAAYQGELKDDELVLTADTVVICGQEILGKPKDEDDARRMLHLLSGRTHEVTTGVCLTTASLQRHFSVTTEVTFKALDEEEIDYYIHRFKPFDKAGAYGIQEWIGYIGCTGLNGSFYNVMGLPLQRIYEELRRPPFALRFDDKTRPEAGDTALHVHLLGPDSHK